MDIKNCRKSIDAIDTEIFLLLEKRFAICEEIGRAKRALRIDTEDTSRENEILSFVPKTKYENEIKEIYKTIFTQSKQLQKSGSEK